MVAFLQVQILEPLSACEPQMIAHCFVPVPYVLDKDSIYRSGPPVLLSEPYDLRRENVSTITPN